MQQKKPFLYSQMFSIQVFLDPAASLDAEVAQNYQSNLVKRVSSRDTSAAKEGMPFNKSASIQM